MGTAEDGLNTVEMFSIFEELKEMKTFNGELPLRVMFIMKRINISIDIDYPRPSKRKTNCSCGLNTLGI